MADDTLKELEKLASSGHYETVRVTVPPASCRACGGEGVVGRKTCPVCKGAGDDPKDTATRGKTYPVKMWVEDKK